MAYGTQGIGSLEPPRCVHRINVHSIRTSNGGREIAAFEEETLALRRELQEARASRTLAENHAAKCVNLAVSRSVTPVNYESSAITSTPVRTALNDTRYISPVSSDPVIANPTSVATSVLRPRSAEVAAPLVNETTQTRDRTDSGVVMSSDSSPEPQLKVDSTDPETNSASPQQPVTTAVTGASDDVARDIVTARCNSGDRKRPEPVANIVYSARLADLLCYGLLDTKAIYDMYYRQTNPLVDEEEEQEAKKKTTNAFTDDDLFAEIVAEVEADLLSTASRKKATIAPFNCPKEEDGSPKDSSSSDTAHKAEGSTRDTNSPLEVAQDESLFSVRLLDLKKRRKKGHSKKSSNGKIRQRGAALENEITSSRSDRHDGRDTMNGNGNPFDGSPFDVSRAASRAIVEVPDVAVLDGGSFVPKDLCSTRALTSRVLTAPSRATYTTAYI